MTKLNATTLAALDPHVAVPGYPRERIEVGVVHFGVGAFHRAHQAVYFDDILAAGDLGWGICGVGVLTQDRTARDILRDQDNLYTLLSVDSDGTVHPRVVGSHVAHLHVPDGSVPVLERLTHPGTKIVSLTITEGGYGVDDATGAFTPRDPATLADMTGAQPPTSVFGLLVGGLSARRTAGTPPFTVLSCDNIAHNGDVTRSALTAFARALDPDLASWIAEHVAFPNSMVDRITPATTGEVRAAVGAYGIDDRWPVRCESFTQWVIEDEFPAGRPALEEVGVQFVEDVAPYEKMKLRLLNATHQVMSYVGVLAGQTYVHDVCRNPVFARYLLDYMHHEAIPTLDPVPGIDLNVYCAKLIERFGSEAIKDTLLRQTVDASDRIPKFVLPVLRHQLATGGDIRRATLTIAAWSRYLQGRTDAGEPITTTDKRLPQLELAVAEEKREPGAFLDQPDIFADLGHNPTFRAAFLDARARLHHDGALAAVSALT